MTIAVTGASGQLGRLVLARLKADPTAGPILALARSPGKLAELDIEARAFDYEAPATLAPALAGVSTLLLISSSEIGKRAAQHRNVIDAAGRAGVGRIVYTSILHADASRISLAAEHRDTETALAGSAIVHTILRNGWYFENNTMAIPAALTNGALVGSAGSGRISWATRADFADAAVAVLTGSGHKGRVYELAGDHAHTHADLAAEISRQTGREIPYRDLPEADYAAILASVGLPEVFARGIASWDVCASRGALYDDSRQLSGLIGRPTATLQEAVAAALR